MTIEQLKKNHRIKLKMEEDKEREELYRKVKEIFSEFWDEVVGFYYVKGAWPQVRFRGHRWIEVRHYTYHSIDLKITNCLYRTTELADLFIEAESWFYSLHDWVVKCQS